MTYITVKYLFSGVSRGNRYFLQRIHFFPELPLLLRQSEGHSARHLRQHTGDGPAGGDWSSRWVKVPRKIPAAKIWQIFRYVVP